MVNGAISIETLFARKLSTIIVRSFGNDKVAGFISDNTPIQQYAAGTIRNMQAALKSAGKGKVRMRKIGLWPFIQPLLTFHLSLSKGKAGVICGFRGDSRKCDTCVTKEPIFDRRYNDLPHNDPDQVLTLIYAGHHSAINVFSEPELRTAPEHWFTEVRRDE